MNQSSIDRLFRGKGNVKLRSIKKGVVDELALLDRAKEEFRIQRDGGTVLPVHLQINRNVDAFADKYHADQKARMTYAKMKKSGKLVSKTTMATTLAQDTFADSSETMDMFRSGHNDGKVGMNDNTRYSTGLIYKEQLGTTPTAVRSPQAVFEVSKQIQNGGHTVTKMPSAIYPHREPLADEPRTLGGNGAFQTGLSRELKMWKDPSFTAPSSSLPEMTSENVRFTFIF
jgi:hypothetical protein